MSAPVRLELQPSRALLGVVCGLHAVAAGVVFHYMVWPLPAVPGLALLLLSLWLAVRRERAKAGVSLTLERDGLFRVEQTATSFTATAGSRAVDFGAAVWLTVSPLTEAPKKWRNKRLMIVSGNLADEGWRQLRIWLRHCAFRAEEQSDSGL